MTHEEKEDLIEALCWINANLPTIQERASQGDRLCVLVHDIIAMMIELGNEPMFLHAANAVFVARRLEFTWNEPNRNLEPTIREMVEKLMMPTEREEDVQPHQDTIL